MFLRGKRESSNVGGKRQAGMAVMMRPWFETWIRLKREQTPKLRDGGREGREDRKPDGNSILYIPPAMTRRVDRERSIFGTELEEPKVVARGGEGGDGGVSKA